MTITADLPHWAFQRFPGCGRAVPLVAHELTCPCYDTRIRVAVASICDHCDLVLDLFGLFTSWDAAISAHQHELDDRALRYFNEVLTRRHLDITTDPPPKRHR